MSNRAIVKKLICGSNNIDLMKNEIQSILQMIFSFLTPEEIQAGGRQTLRFDSENYCWWFQGSGRGIFFIQCQVRTIRPVGWRNVYRTNSNKLSQSPSIENVQVTWEGLPSLLDGVDLTFPWFKERVKSFLKAAEVQF